GPRSDGEVVDQQVVGMARVEQIAVVVRQILEPRVRGLDEDLGLVAGGAQHALDAQHLVPDGIAVAERGEHLVNGANRHRVTGPEGMRARTSAAGGSVRRLRAKNPGSGSRASAVRGSRASRSNVSRYLRSITGHA